jgi:hypothetical protein
VRVWQVLSDLAYGVMVTACILTGRIAGVRCESSGLCLAGDLAVGIVRDGRYERILRR